MSSDNNRPLSVSQALSRLTEVKTPGHILPGATFLLMIFKTESVTIPGDERSRKNPGHGYPEHTETFSSTKIYCTQSEDLLKKALEALYLQDQHRTDVVAVKVGGKVSVRTAVEVSL